MLDIFSLLFKIIWEWKFCPEKFENSIRKKLRVVYSCQAWLCPVHWNVFLMPVTSWVLEKGCIFSSFVDALYPVTEQHRKTTVNRDLLAKGTTEVNLHLLAFVACKEVNTTLQSKRAEAIWEAAGTILAMGYSFLLAFLLCNALISACRACSCLPSHPQNEYCNSAVGEYFTSPNITTL